VRSHKKKLLGRWSKLGWEHLL